MRTWGLFGALGVAVFVFGCGGESDSETTPPGTGGSADGGTAGSTAGSGGSPTSGGSAGSGGSQPTAGSAGTGATAGTGGEPTAGSPGTGGEGTGGEGAGGEGTGGRAGSGGGRTGGTGGAAGDGTGGGRTGGAGGMPDCCGVDIPCPPGHSCQGTRNDRDTNAGTCEPTPTDGGCWNDLDCRADGLCTGGNTCACNVLCFAPPSPGTCTPMGEPCCHTSEDCTDPQICVGAGVFTKGRCVAPPAGNECYTDRDCRAGTCSGASACECGVNCPTMPGTCVSP